MMMVGAPVQVSIKQNRRVLPDRHRREPRRSGVISTSRLYLYGDRCQARQAGFLCSTKYSCLERKIEGSAENGI